MTTDPKDNAFPILNAEGDVYVGQGGLSKREYFASLGMQGLVMFDPTCEFAELAGDAVRCADALIAALKEGGQANG